MLRMPNHRLLVLVASLVTVLLASCGYLNPAGGTDAPISLPDAEPPPTEEPGTLGQTGQFDFYVLSLSWSPDYCASQGNQDPQQCSIGRKLGFVLHGLWPEYETGYPSDCSTTRLPASLRTKYAGLYPSPKLFDHEWEKHGTCSGLAPESYLALSKKLKESVVIPARYQAPEQPVRVTSIQLKKDFVAANASLTEKSLATFCSGSGRYLQELYACYTPDGKPRACSAEIQKRSARSCQGADFLMRNVR